MMTTSDPLRTEIVRNVLLKAILSEPLGQRLFHQDAATRHQIELFVRTVLTADAMFESWGEPFALRDRFVVGMADQFVRQLESAQDLDRAIRAEVLNGLSKNAADLRQRLGMNIALDTPPDGV
jgi:hypothetical protein